MKKMLLLTALSIIYLTAFSQIRDTSSRTNRPESFSNKNLSNGELEFPGGNEKWKEYLATNLNTDIPRKNKAPKGTYKVIVIFFINSYGSINGVIPKTNLGYGMEEEVIRVIKNSPQWLPVLVDGIPMNAARQQPVVFNVE